MRFVFRSSKCCVNPYSGSHHDSSFLEFFVKTHCDLIYIFIYILAIANLICHATKYIFRVFNHLESERYRHYYKFP